MRGVAYALIASGALMFGALASGSASAGCYRDCDDDYQSGPSYYRSAPRSYERYERYDDRPAYRSYREPCCERTAYYGGPRYHTTYYERGPEYPVGYYERPLYRASYYGNGYYGNGYYGNGYGPYHHHHYGCGYGYGCGGYYPTVRYGGAWTQTAYGYANGYGYGNGYYGNGYYGNGYYGGCHTAYIPYGWTWYRASSC